ncbi:MAG: ferritin-like domain-containing protein [Rhodoglobus sp.]
MFNQSFIRNAIDRSAENALDRRRFLRAAGLAGVVGAGTVAVGAGPAGAVASRSYAAADAPSDSAILNFALNLEYLEAEFYARAVTGAGLDGSLLSGVGTRGKVTGGRKVDFQTPAVRQYAKEIAGDEIAHVTFLRAALGSAAVAEPAISLDAAFAAAAQAAGLGAGFDAFANENNFLLAAFIFEDVGVTAYKGAAPLITNKTFLEAAAGILAVEAYHAANIRTSLVAKGLQSPNAKIFETVQAISNLRDSVDSPTDVDQGIGTAAAINIVPTDANGLAYSRTPGDVLNIVYLTPTGARKGGFFPAGVNGTINTSSGQS